MSILNDMFYKGNRSLKPHQPGMAKTGEVRQGFVGSPHFESEIYPCLEVPYYSAVWVVGRANHGVYLVRDCSVRNGSGLVLQGMKGVILGTVI